MSINGTMAPRKLNIPTRYAGASGSFVSNGQSSTSSTSKTGRQNRSREGLRDVSIRALLLAPILVARRIFRGHQDHRNHVELRVPLEVAANLKAVSVRHHHIE